MVMRTTTSMKDAKLSFVHVLPRIQGVRSLRRCVGSQHRLEYAFLQIKVTPRGPLRLEAR